MRILICDDEPLIVENIKKNVVRYFKSNHIHAPEIATYTNGSQMLDDTGDKDIVFIDIEMPGMNGVYLGKELHKRNKNTIIFVVTSFAEYLDEAMRFNVFRYLSKPIDKQRFDRNMKDAIDKYNSTTINIPIETKDSTHIVSVSDIIAVQTESGKVVVHTLKTEYDSIKSMDYWEQYLPKNKFFRSYRSFIVNFEHITDYSHTNITLTKDINAYISRRKYTEFKERYLLFLESMR